VSAAELSALSVIVHAGPLAPTALARLEQVQPPSMSRTVRGLEKRHLVDRAPDPNDGRAVRLSATPAGREILEAGRERRLRVLYQRLEELKDEDVDAIRSVLDVLDALLP
jgi:DNA-binding MarR family transcriptional regulator